MGATVGFVLSFTDMVNELLSSPPCPSLTVTVIGYSPWSAVTGLAKVKVPVPSLLSTKLPKLGRLLVEKERSSPSASLAEILKLRVVLNFTERLRIASKTGSELVVVALTVAV